MKREFDRYVVIKNSDLEYALEQGTLIGADIDSLKCILESVNLERHRRGKSDLTAVVVEHGWPEYEPVWNAIQLRVDGPKPLPLMSKDVLSLVNEISNAVLTDEIAEGCDISAGMFGPAFSQLIHRLADYQSKATAFDMLRNLLGYVEKGTDDSITLFQSPATMCFCVSNREWWEIGLSLEQALKIAFEKHEGN